MIASMPFTIIQVASLDASLSLVPVIGVARELHRYPVSPQGTRLQLRRRALGMSLTAAATALGLTVAEVNDLERGRATLSSEAEWRRAERALREAAGVGADVMR